MPKTSRLMGPSRAGVQEQPAVELPAGAVVDLAGADSAMRIAGELTVGGEPAGRQWNTGRSFSAAEMSPVDLVVSASARASNVVTLTVLSGHGILAGDLITVALATAGFDGTFTVSSVTATTILYAQTGSDQSGGAGTVARQLKRISTFGLPGIVLPADRTTKVLIGAVGFPPEALGHGMTIGFDIGNDAAESGENIVYRLLVRKFDSFGAMNAPVLALDSTEIVGGPAAGNQMTVTHASWGNVVVTPHDFGSLFGFELHRVGDSAFDEMDGPIRLLEFAATVGSL